MPKNKVSDPITDQEMAFARLILAGGMTDRHAAEAVGLNPDSAAYTKSKPHVRAYMLEHRAAVQQQLVQQEADGLHRLNLDRERVLTRLWEIANLSSEMTQGSITGQVKALSMIIALEGLIPDRRAADRLSALFREEILSRAHPANLSRGLARAAGHHHRPAARACPCRARSCSWPSPGPNSLPPPWPIRLRTPAPARPPSPSYLALRKPLALMFPCSPLLPLTWGIPFL